MNRARARTLDVEVPGGTLHARVRGPRRDGPVGAPIVLVGGTGAASNFAGAHVRAAWDRHPVVTFDPRGLGHSTAPPDPDEATTAAMAEDLARVLDAAGAAGWTAGTGEPWHVCGFSLGGAVAQELALARPDLVGGLSLHATFARGAGVGRSRLLDPERLAALEAGDLEPFARAALVENFTPAFRERHGRRVDAMMRAFLADPPDPAAILAQTRAAARHDALDRLHTVTCPALVTHGADDPRVPVSEARALADALPRAHLHVFTGPHAGHLYALEDPDAFHAVWTEFLDRHHGPSAA